MDVLGRACELGVVTAAEVARGLVQISPNPAADRLTVEVRRRPVADVRPSGGPGRDGERDILIRLADLDLGPRLIAVTAVDLWTETLQGRPLGGRSLAELTDGCAALGAALAKLHRAAAPASGEPPAPRPPGPWSTACRGMTGRGVSGRGGPLSGPSRSDRLDTVRQGLRSDPALRAAAVRVEQRWSHRHWTIGHLEPETIVVEAAPYYRVRFADVSEAGLGNPDWDLAACLGVIATVAGGGLPSAASRGSADWLAEHFLHGYRRLGGPGHVHPHVQAVHAVSMAWRRAGDRDGGATVKGWTAVEAWMARAHRLAERHPGLVSAA